MVNRFVLNIIFLFLASTVFVGCKTDSNNEKSETIPYVKISGSTMGTYYVVTTPSKKPEKLKNSIDSLLSIFNLSLSTYIPTSTISMLNKSEKGIEIPPGDQYLLPVLKRAEELHTLTSGSFNAALMPIINYWGFGYKEKQAITDADKQKVSELLAIVNSGKLEILSANGKEKIVKPHPQYEIDFSALAKGYGIDVLARYLSQKGHDDYLIDIGGESRAQGLSGRNQPWLLAINTPRESANQNELELAIKLENRSMATSGNYRNFYQNGGLKYGHIIDPKTGFPALTDLLSATIIADDCMTADGLATAMMVMGLEDSKVFLEKNNYPACLIYDEDGDDILEKYYTNGFKDLIVEEKN